MKAPITRRSLCVILPLLLLFATPSRAQVTVTSSNGYSVYIAVTPTAIVSHTANCPLSYHYDITYSYNVTFSGNNIPSNLYTLVGYFTCSNVSNLFYLPVSGGSGTLTTVSNPSGDASNCATTPTPATMGCLSGYQLIIEGPGITLQTVSVTPSVGTGTGLPITLKTFDARMQGSSSVALAWTTSVETGRNVFYIERSNNGSDWSALTSIEGKGGDNGSTYAFTDDRPRPGMNYYRLKSSSDDGKAPEYSRIIAAKIFSPTTDIAIYPNPGYGNTLRFSGLSDPGSWKMELCNAAGQRFMSAALTSADVSLPDLAQGLYFVRLTNGATGDNTTLKYMRQ